MDGWLCVVETLKSMIAMTEESGSINLLWLGVETNPPPPPCQRKGKVWKSVFLPLKYSMLSPIPLLMKSGNRKGESRAYAMAYSIFSPITYGGEKMKLEIDNNDVIIVITNDELDGTVKLPNKLYNALNLGKYYDIRDKVTYPSTIEYRKTISITDFIEIMENGGFTWCDDENDNI